MVTLKRSLIGLLFLSTSFVTFSSRAEASDDLKNRVRAYRTAHELAILQEYFDLLSIPNVASDRENIRRNAAAIMKMMEKRGITTRLLEPPTERGAPSVYGELKTKGAKQTIVLYAHYDGQPTDPSQWIGSKPWEPVLRTASLGEGGRIVPLDSLSAVPAGLARIYARSASDDKAPIIALLAALDALRASKLSPTVNLKFLFDGEEEAGSPNLEAILKANKELLKSDGWIICDGPVHQNGQKSIFFGVRGITTADITIYGATRDLHSGHYGNWAPNPALMLAQLLASMKDKSGHVLIKGYYDDVDPLSETERQAISSLPDYDRHLMEELGLKTTEVPTRSLGESIMLPSLTINGISSGYVGAQARTSIPSIAAARIDMRLVRGNDPKRQFERLKAHIQEEGYTVIGHEPSMAERLATAKLVRVTTRGGYKALRTSMDLPFSRQISNAVQGVCDQRVVLIPSHGGSVPLSFIPDIFKVPVVGVPIVNHDNNQHSENENLILQNLWDGMEILASLMRMY